MDKLKVPGGRNNYERISNICTYDLLSHIQSNSNGCILHKITDNYYNCYDYMSIFDNNDFKETVMKRVGDIPFEFKSLYKPYEDETDEHYEARLYEIYMLIHDSVMYKQIRCNFCIQKWLKSNNW